VQKDPRSANAWAALSLMVCEEHKHGFNVRPDPLQRALDAARRATTIDPAAHLGQHALAQAHFFRKEFEPFRVAADRAIALNPWDAVTVAFMGILMAYSGDWDHGVQLARDAARLNPHHPGWFSFAEVWWHYRRQEWQEALAVAQHINMPTYFYTPVVLAFCYARLGRRDEARRALDEALAMVPDLADIAEAELSKWLPPDVVEMSVEGLRMAGLGE
jgi:adenylate cyclase